MQGEGGALIRPLHFLGKNEPERITTMAVRSQVHKTKRRDLCQRCGRRIPPVALQHEDPFCSRVCAEATYGTAARPMPRRMGIGGLRRRTA